MGSLGLLIIALGLALYFLPAILGRHKRNHASILLFNLLLGWTVIGWVIALIWAVSQDAPAPVSVAPVTTLPAAAFCSTCGASLNSQDLFCRNCGNKVRNSAA